MTVNDYQVSWQHVINVASTSTTDKDKSDRTLSTCIITKKITEGFQVKYEPVSSGLFITDSDYQFNRKHAIFESFKIAVSLIKEQDSKDTEQRKLMKLERTKLWDKFWEVRKHKPLVLLVDRDKSLRDFLEKTASRKIEGKHIKYIVPTKTEIWYPRIS